MSKSPLQRALEHISPGVLAEHLGPALGDLQYCWPAWARPEQLLPDDQHIVLLMAGRRFGKTRCAAEWVRRRVEAGIARNLILVAPTHNDMLTDMLNGPSGLITISPPWDKPKFLTTDNTLTWSNGSRAICLSAERPERTRGKEIDTVWCDEIAVWNYPEMWDLLQFCGGSLPMRFVVTSTPRPTPLVRRLLKESSLVITGSTYDNSPNLDAEFISSMRAKYDGTRLGRQELYAEVLDDIEGALWSHALIDKYRVKKADVENIQFRRMVVAVDPSGSAKKEADEAGIVVAGIADCPLCSDATTPHGFVFEDLSGRYSPNDMGRKAIDAYHRHDADRIVAEDNFGGQIIEDLMRLIEPSVSYRAVHASRGKIVRAEPVAALYERGQVHHIGMLAKLEDELCTYTPQEPKSPGRMDALVWALTDLMLGEQHYVGSVNVDWMSR